MRAARTLAGVDLVVVVDDGSGDETARTAYEAGAVVTRHRRNRGKAAAMETGAALVARLEREAGEAPRALLFLDADLEDTAAAAGALIPPVLAGEADMTIAILPPQRAPAAGAGSSSGSRATRHRTRDRLVPDPAAVRSALPDPRGVRGGAAAGSRIRGGDRADVDLLRQGFRVREVEVDLHHRVTGTGLARSGAPGAAVPRRRPRPERPPAASALTLGP